MSAAAYQRALDLLRAGARAEARAALDDLLRADPAHPESWHLKGVMALEDGDAAAALEDFRRALTIRPEFPEARMNLGNALVDRGRVAEGLVEIRAAIRLAPQLAMAHNSLGLAFQQLRQWQPALAAHRRALEQRADYPEAWTNLGNVHLELGQAEEAVTAHRRALALQPGSAIAHINLGTALRAAGRLDEAIAAYREGVALDPTHVSAQNELAMTLRGVGRQADALVVLEAARLLAPDHAITLANLGIVMSELGRLAEAREALGRSLALEPGAAPAHYALGNVLRDLGAAGEAAAAFRAAVRLDPGFTEAWSNLLFILNFLPGETDASLVRANREWAATLAPSAAPPAFANTRDPRRRLRVGYVSTEFRRHHFLMEFLPVLAAHDRAAVEIVCYADVAAPDEDTGRVAALADSFRNLHGQSPAAQADTIRADSIDILVSLTGYLARDRQLLARRAAPVQATYVNHLTTTGLATVDYRIADEWLDPAGDEIPEDPEHPVRLASGFSVFAPPGAAPPPGEPPCRRNGFITFGSFNNLLKVTDATLVLWAAVLARVDTARLLVKARELSRADVRAAFTARLAGAGIDPRRCDLVGGVADRLENLGYYARADIGLDPVPFAGGATSREMLWMGLPVVTLRGATRAARLGASLLARAGLPELVTTGERDYVETAAGLARDPERLVTWRAGQRERLGNSPLLDAVRHTRELEGAYRWMWERWCAEGRG